MSNEEGPPGHRYRSWKGSHGNSGILELSSLEQRPFQGIPARHQSLGIQMGKQGVLMEEQVSEEVLRALGVDYTGEALETELALLEDSMTSFGYWSQCFQQASCPSAAASTQACLSLSSLLEISPKHF